MNKLEDGMYVRTKYGINEIIEICCEHYSFNKELVKLKKGYIDDDFEYRQFIDKKDIINASHNIIDLIEVGDYVNGAKIKEILEMKTGKIIIISESEDYLENDEIESIVTKEMYSNVEYRVENKRVLDIEFKLNEIIDYLMEDK